MIVTGLYSILILVIISHPFTNAGTQDSEISRNSLSPSFNWRRRLFKHAKFRDGNWEKWHNHNESPRSKSHKTIISIISVYAFPRRTPHLVQSKVFGHSEKHHEAQDVLTNKAPLAFSQHSLSYNGKQDRSESHQAAKKFDHDGRALSEPFPAASMNAYPDGNYALTGISPSLVDLSFQNAFKELENGVIRNHNIGRGHRENHKKRDFSYQKKKIAKTSTTEAPDLSFVKIFGINRHPAAWQSLPMKHINMLRNGTKDLNILNVSKIENKKQGIFQQGTKIVDGLASLLTSQSYDYNANNKFSGIADQTHSSQAGPSPNQETLKSKQVQITTNSNKGHFNNVMKGTNKDIVPHLDVHEEGNEKLDLNKLQSLHQYMSNLGDEYEEHAKLNNPDRNKPKTKDVMVTESKQKITDTSAFRSKEKSSHITSIGRRLLSNQKDTITVGKDLQHRQHGSKSKDKDNIAVKGGKNNVKESQKMNKTTETTTTAKPKNGLSSKEEDPLGNDVASLFVLLDDDKLMKPGLSSKLKGSKTQVDGHHGQESRKPNTKTSASIGVPATHASLTDVKGKPRKHPSDGAPAGSESHHRFVGHPLVMINKKGMNGRNTSKHVIAGVITLGIFLSFAILLACTVARIRNEESSPRRVNSRTAFYENHPFY